MIRLRVVEASDSARISRNPQPSSVVQVQGPDESSRDSIGLSEHSKTTIVITGQAAVIKPQPEIVSGILAVGGGRAARRKTVRFGVEVKRLIRSLPPDDCVAHSRSYADPDVTVRVFKQTIEIIARKLAVVVAVDGLRRCMCELFHARHTWKAI